MNTLGPPRAVRKGSRHGEQRLGLGPLQGLRPYKTTSDPAVCGTAGINPATHWTRWLTVILLGGYLLFCHGCHGEEDNELFTELCQQQRFAREVQATEAAARGLSEEALMAEVFPSAVVGQASARAD